MKLTTFRSLFVTILATVFLLTLFLHYFNVAVNGKEFATYPTNEHLYDEGKIVRAGIIYDRDGNILAQTVDGKRIFNDSKDVRCATVHAVGDLEGNVSTGIHSAYLKELTAYSVIDGVYDTDNLGNNITLTLDVEMCIAAYKALGNQKGTVGVMNWKTGEILCMVSTPAFDPNFPDDVVDDSEKGAYVNRFLSGQYAPGSTFKVVTALSGIENINNIDDCEYLCQAGVTIGGEWLSCMYNHGSQNVTDSMVESCNSTFAQIAVEVGNKKLLKTAEDLGFNKKVTLGNINCAQSTLDLEEIRDIDLGWAGIGQHNDLVNPYHYLTVMAAFANEGVLVEPKLVSKIITPKGITLKKAGNGRNRIIKKEDAIKVGDMMRKVMTDHYGESGFSGLEVCGKTGTAEISKAKEPHSWFVGFCRNPDTPYAFVSVVENGGMGAGIAKTVASKVLNA